MKTALLVLLLAFAPVVCQAQIHLNEEPKDETVISKDSFVLIVQKHDFDAGPSGGVGSSCMVVYPNGKYRIERQMQYASNLQGSSRVFEGQLDPTELAKAREIINSPDFRQLKVAEPQGMMIQTRESLRVTVIRANGEQSMLITDQNRRDADKQLKPFVNWEKSLEKRKAQELKGAKLTNCATGPLRMED
jgi:hypothetical protein